MSNVYRAPKETFKNHATREDVLSNGGFFGLKMASLAIGLGVGFFTDASVGAKVTTALGAASFYGLGALAQGANASIVERTANREQYYALPHDERPEAGYEMSGFFDNFVPALNPFYNIPGLNKYGL